MTSFLDDDDDDFMSIIQQASTNEKPPEPPPVVVDEKPQVPTKAHSLSVESALRLARSIDGLRCVPVVDRLPIVKGWTDPTFFSRPMDEMILAWADEFGDVDFAFALGDQCGDGGDIVMEADNEAGAKYLAGIQAQFPCRVSTRRGYPHLHVKMDIPGRGNRIDLFGSVRKHRDQARAAGFVVDYRKGMTDEERAAVDEQRAKALSKIPMGPVIDIKSNGGQAMMPGGRTSKAPGFRYSELDGAWTAEMWAARPVFDPSWFPDEVWTRHEAVASDGGGNGYDRDYWTSDRREAAAMRYAMHMKPTVSGQGAHGTFLRNAILIVRGFDLDVPAGRRVLTAWAQQVCAHDPWDMREIEHKLKDAFERGQEPMGFKLSTRSGMDTAGERYSRMLRALADDTMSAEDEGEFLSHLMADSIAPLVDAPIPAPAAVEVRPLAAIDAEIISANQDHASERQLLGQYGLDWDEVRRDPRLGVNITRVDGRATKFNPTTLNVTQWLLRSRMFKGKIRKNLMSHDIELEGVAITNVMKIKEVVDTIFDSDVPKERIEDALESVAMRNAYDASAEDFARIPTWDGVPRLWSVVGDIIPVPQDSIELSRTKMARTILAMVARTLSPGCKCDTVCILISLKQGFKKSTFWKELTGEKFFNDDSIDSLNNDDRIKISRFRCIEIAEIDSLYGKQETARLKAFFSRAVDTYRLPYAKRMISVPRRSIFVGSSNKNDILTDDTGNRRYWPIPVSGRVDLDQLRATREQIFAEAIHLVTRHMAEAAMGRTNSAAYRAGQWWLSEDEDDVLDVDNLKYQEQDPWHGMVQGIVKKMSPGEKFQISTIIEELRIPIDRVDRRTSMRIGGILTTIGCKRVNDGRAVRVGDVVGKFFERPDLDLLPLKFMT